MTHEFNFYRKNLTTEPLLWGFRIPKVSIKFLWCWHCRNCSGNLLDGTCASGGSHLRFFWHGKGIYKALRGSFVVVGNAYTVTHLLLLSIFFAHICLLCLLYHKRILTWIDKLIDHFCAEGKEELEPDKLLPPWIMMYLNFWLHLHRYFGVLCHMPRDSAAFLITCIGIFPCTPEPLIWCTRKRWEGRLGGSAWANLISVFSYLVGHYSEDWGRIFSDIHGERMGNGHKLKHGKFLLDISWRKAFHWGWLNLGNYYFP